MTDILDTPTPRPMAGTWILTAPDGRTWQAATPLRCAADEMRERVPAAVAMARIRAAADEERRAADSPLQAPDHHEDEWVVEVVSSGPLANLPLLQWRSADVSLNTPIGARLYVHAAPDRKGEASPQPAGDFGPATGAQAGDSGGPAALALLDEAARLRDAGDIGARELERRARELLRGAHGGTVDASAQPFVRVAGGDLPEPVFAERLACSRVAEKFMGDHPEMRGTAGWMAANIISASILGRSAEAANCNPRLEGNDRRHLHPHGARASGAQTFSPQTPMGGDSHG